MKNYTLNTPYSTETVYLVKSNYVNGNSLYVGLRCEDGEPFMDVTTNLDTDYNLPPQVFGENCAYVQIGDVYGVHLVRFLAENGIANEVGVTVASGFNAYTLMDFSPSVTEMKALR